MQISIIGGRVIPAFTHNWLIKSNRTNLSSPPMGRFDILALVWLAFALIIWVVWPDQTPSAAALLVASLLQATRLSRWSGLTNFSNPSLFVLHAGYAFVPLGAALMASSILFPDAFGAAASQHVWMAGAIGCMTLALMTRATLGHSGQELRAGFGTVLIYLSVIGASVARVFGDFTPIEPMAIYATSASLWIAAFLGFALLYWRSLVDVPRDQPIQQN